MIQETNWIQFYNQFAGNHDQFIKALSEEIPNLTSTQFKVCVYLRAGYSTREIADDLRVSVRAVENHRYRLRKRMNLSHSESLTTHLMKY